MNEILEVYEKYKHLDELLSDKGWLGDSALNQAVYDFWQAIKLAASQATLPESEDERNQ